MKTNKIVVLIVSTLLAITISTLLPTYEQTRMDKLVETIYTVSGIMFSIGMGVICTFNPNGIKNKGVLSTIENDIFNVRNSFLFYFGLSTLLFIIQTTFDLNYTCFRLVFDIKMVTLSISITSIIYYIINFQAIQKLNLDIVKRMIGEDK